MRFAECPSCALLTPVTVLVRAIVIRHDDADWRQCPGSGATVELTDVSELTVEAQQR